GRAGDEGSPHGPARRGRHGPSAGRHPAPESAGAPTGSSSRPRGPPAGRARAPAPPPAWSSHRTGSDQLVIPSHALLSAQLSTEGISGQYHFKWTAGRTP